MGAYPLLVEPDARIVGWIAEGEQVDVRQLRSGHPSVTRARHGILGRPCCWVTTRSYR